MEVLKWMEALPISDWITTSDWGFPIMLVFHSVGLAAVVGITAMLDLRVLGFARTAPLAAFEPLMSVAWIGFFINAISGSLLFMADASRLIVNWPFITKMTCVLLGGVTSALLWRQLHRSSDAHIEQPPTAPPVLQVNAGARVLAVVSLVLWGGAILFGRLIAYIMDAAMLHGDIK
jgi:hypothetical protein